MDSIRPARTRLLLACALAALALAALPASALALPASTTQVPMEVRPSQGPAGSSTIVYADGFDLGEVVRLYVDGALEQTTTAGQGGFVAPVVPMPDAVGVHRVLLYGETSAKSAAAAFTTTPGGAERPAMLAAPRPLLASGRSDGFPHRSLIRAANFAPSTQLSLDYGGSSRLESTVLTTDMRGDLETSVDWNFSTVLAVGLAESPTGSVLAADSVIAPATGYTPARRLRAVPTVAGADERVFLLGNGFTASAPTVTPEEDGIAGTSAAADANGDVTLTDDAGGTGTGGAGRGSRYRLLEGTDYAAGGFYRSSVSVPATVGVTRDLAAPGEETSVVGVRLAAMASAVTIKGLDAGGTEKTLSTTATTDGNGVLAPAAVTIPSDAATGPYRIEVSDGTNTAYATLAVSGSIAVPALRLSLSDDVVALPPDGQGTASLAVFNDTESSATYTVGSSDPNVVPGQSSVTVAANGSANVTLTVSGDTASPGSSNAAITVSDGGSVSRTATLQRLTRSVSISSPAQSRRLDAASSTPVTVSGTADPNEGVRLLAVDGDGQGWGSSLKVVTADGSGNWTATINPQTDLQDGLGYGDHFALRAVPSEVSDSGAYQFGPGRLLVSYFDDAFEEADVATTTSTFEIEDLGDGLDDQNVYGPYTTTDAFDEGLSIDAATSDGASVMASTDSQTHAYSESGDTTVVQDGTFDEMSSPTTVRRTYTIGPDARHTSVVDRYANPSGQARTLRVTYEVDSGIVGSDNEYRVSTGDAWIGDAEYGGDFAEPARTLVSGSNAPREGFVLTHDEDGNDAHNLVTWHRRPAEVATRANDRDELLLTYELTIPAGGSADVLHEIGSTPTDAAALALAGSLADTLAPELDVTSPADGSTTSSREVTVAGTVRDDIGAVSLTVAGQSASVGSDGRFSHTVTLPDSDGTHQIAVVATDPAGNEQRATRSVNLSRPTPPPPPPPSEPQQPQTEPQPPQTETQQPAPTQGGGETQAPQPPEGRRKAQIGGVEIIVGSGRGSDDAQPQTVDLSNARRPQLSLGSVYSEKGATVLVEATTAAPSRGSRRASVAGKSKRRAKRGVSLGKARVSLDPGESAPLRIRLSKRALRSLGKGRSVKVSVRFTVTERGARRATKATKTFRLKVVKPKKKQRRKRS